MRKLRIFDTPFQKQGKIRVNLTKTDDIDEKPSKTNFYVEIFEKPSYSENTEIKTGISTSRVF